MSRLSEGTIARVLFYIRAEAIREGLQGQDHVEALLRLRGHDPDSKPVPLRRPKTYARGTLAAKVLGALRDGPRAVGDMGVESPIRAYRCLLRLQKAGEVRREGRLWGLAR